MSSNKKVLKHNNLLPKQTFSSEIAILFPAFPPSIHNNTFPLGQILKGSLNSSLKNKDWETKLNGDGKSKNCIKRSADLIVNKEFLDKKAWNKDEIEKRTKILSDNFLEIWSIK